MHRSKLPSFARWIGVLAAVVAAAGISLEALVRARPRAGGHPRGSRPTRPPAPCSSDRRRRRSRGLRASTPPTATRREPRTRPRSPPASGPTTGNSPWRPSGRSTRRRARNCARPPARPRRPRSSGSQASASSRGDGAVRRRRSRAASGARGRLRIAPEGSRPAPGNEAMVDEGTRAIVIDAEFPAALARLPGARRRSRTSRIRRRIARSASRPAPTRERRRALAHRGRHARGDRGATPGAGASSCASAPRRWPTRRSS